MAGASTLRLTRHEVVDPGTTAAVAAGVAPRPRVAPRFWLGVAAAVLVGLGLRVAIGATDDAPSTDETAYLGAGLSLVEGTGFARDGHAELHFRPLVPALLGGAALVVPDPHTGAVVLTWLTGTAAIVPLALLGRRVGGARAGVAVASVAALAPGLATTPAARGAGSEAEYTLLVVTAVWLAVDAGAQQGRAGATARAAGAGLALGLAYLARPEGLLLAVPMALALGTPRRRAMQSRLPALAASTLALALCVAPYARYLHTHTGRWELTAKTQDVSLEAWAAVARGDREARDRELYTPDASGWRLPAARSSLPALARDDPGGYATVVGTNVAMLARNLAGWWLLPLPLWLLAARGAWRRRRDGSARLLVALGVLPVATALAFFVQPRYLVVTTAAACVLAGAELADLAPRWRRPAAATAAGLLLAGSLAAFAGPGGWWHPVDHTDQRRAGDWLAAHAGPGDRVMARSFPSLGFIGDGAG
jgi:hypothetical protein